MFQFKSKMKKINFYLLISIFCIFIFNKTIFAEELINYDINSQIKDQTINVELGKDYKVQGAVENLIINIPDGYKNTITITGLKVYNSNGKSIFKIGKNTDMTINIPDYAELTTQTESLLSVDENSKVKISGDGIINLENEDNYIINSKSNAEIKIDVFAWYVSTSTSPYSNPEKITITSQRHADYYNNILNLATADENRDITNRLINNHPEIYGDSGSTGGSGSGGGGTGSGGSGTGSQSCSVQKNQLFVTNNGSYFKTDCADKVQYIDISDITADTIEIIITNGTKKNINLNNKNIKELIFEDDTLINLTLNNTKIQSLQMNNQKQSVVNINFKTNSNISEVYSNNKSINNSNIIRFWGLNSENIQSVNLKNTIVALEPIVSNGNLIFPDLGTIIKVKNFFLENSWFYLTHNMTLQAEYVSSKNSFFYISDGAFLSNETDMDSNSSIQIDLERINDIDGTKRYPNMGLLKKQDISNLTSQKVMVYPIVNNTSSILSDVANQKVAFKVNDSDWFWTYTDDLGKIYIPINMEIDKNTIEVKFGDEYYEKFGEESGKIFKKEINAPYVYKNIYLFDPEIISVEFTQPTTGTDAVVNFTLWGWHIFGDFQMDLVYKNNYDNQERLFRNTIFNANGQTIPLTLTNYADNSIELEIRISIDGELLYTHPTKLLLPGKIIKNTSILNFEIPDNIKTEIKEKESKINVVMPYYSDLTNLTPKITIIDGSTVNPNSNTAQDFTNPINYTVTAPDGSTKTYTVIVSKIDAPKITTFNFSRPNSDGKISIYITGTNLPENIYMKATPNRNTHNITTNNFEKNYNNYTNTITIPQDILINDFSTIYNIKFYDAQNDTEIENITGIDTITIGKTLSAENKMTAFSIVGQKHSKINQDNKTIIVTMPYNFTFGVKRTPSVINHTGIAISPDRNEQITINENIPVTYTVIAENGNRNTYTVYFIPDEKPSISTLEYTEDLSSIGGNQIIKIHGNNFYSADNIKIKIRGTDFSEEKNATFDNTTASASFSIPVNLTNVRKFYYIDIYIDGVKYYFNTTPNFIVKPVLNQNSSIYSFSIPGQKESVIEGNLITVTMPYYELNKRLIPVIDCDSRASLSPAKGVAIDFTEPVSYKVTAENGVVEYYTVVVNNEPTPTPEDILFENPLPKGGSVSLELQGENFDYSNNIKLIFTPNNDKFNTIERSLTKVSNIKATGSVNIPLNETKDTVAYNIKVVIDGKIYPSSKSLSIAPAIYNENKITYMGIEGSKSVEIKENIVEVVMAKGVKLTSVPTTINTSVGSKVLNKKDNYSYKNDFQIIVEAQNGNTHTYTIKPKVDQTIEIRSAEISQSNSVYTVKIKGQNLQNINNLKLFLNCDVEKIEYTTIAKTDNNGDTYYESNITGLENRTTKEKKYVVSVIADSEKEITFNNAIITIPSTLSAENDITSFNVDGAKSVDINADKIIVKVPFYFNISNVAPIITISQDATISPLSGEYRNFETEQQYIVTSNSGIPKTYNVIFTKDETPEFSSIEFSKEPTFEGGEFGVLINATKTENINTLKLRVLDSSNNFTDYEITDLKTIINIPENTSINSKNYHFQIIADGQIFELNEILSIPPKDDGGNSILTFIVNNAISTEINYDTINVVVPYGYDLQNVVPTYTTSVGATISQTLSGNYTTPKTITITSEKGISKDYTISIVYEDFNNIKITGLQYTKLLYPQGGENEIRITFNKDLLSSEISIMLGENNEFEKLIATKTDEANTYLIKKVFAENNTHQDKEYLFDIYVNNNRIMPEQYAIQIERKITIKGLDMTTTRIRSFEILGQKDSNIDNTNKTITVTMPFSWIPTSTIKINNIEFFTDYLSTLSEIDTLIDSNISLPIYYKEKELLDTYTLRIIIEKEPKIISFTGETEFAANVSTVEFNLIVQNIPSSSFKPILEWGDEKIEGTLIENTVDNYKVIFAIPKNDTKTDKIYNIKLYLNDELIGLDLKTLTVKKGTTIRVNNFIVENSKSVNINEDDNVITVLMPFGTDLSNLNYSFDLDDGLRYELFSNDDNFENIVIFKILNEGDAYKIYSVIVSLDEPEAPSQIDNFDYVVNNELQYDLIVSTSNLKENDEIIMKRYLNEVLETEETIIIENNYKIIHTGIDKYKKDTQDYQYKYEIYLNNELVTTITFNRKNEPEVKITKIVSEKIEYNKQNATISIIGENTGLLKNAIIKLCTETEHISPISARMENDNFVVEFILPVNETYRDKKYKIEIELDNQKLAEDEYFTVLAKPAPPVSFTVSFEGEIDKKVDGNTITITMPTSTDVTRLKPTIVYSKDYSIDKDLTELVDFSQPVTYTLTLDDLTFTYIVKVVLADKAEIKSLVFEQPTDNNPKIVKIEIKGSNLDSAKSIKVVAENKTKKITANVEVVKNKYIASLEIPKNTTTKDQEYNLSVIIDDVEKDMKTSLIVPKKSNSSTSGGGGGSSSSSGGNHNNSSNSGSSGNTTVPTPNPPEKNDKNIVINKKNAYIKGYLDGTFLPYNNITRAEVASIISRLVEGFDSNKNYKNDFQDVQSTDWFYDAVSFAHEKKIINGSYGYYHPNDNITRGEFSAIIYRLLGETSQKTSRFADVQGTFFEKEISALTDRNIVSGYLDGSFRPNNPITRAEAVKMINAAFDITKINRETSFKDVHPTDWFYADVLNACN